MPQANVRVTSAGNFYINSGQFDEATFNPNSGYYKNLYNNTNFSTWTYAAGTISLTQATLAPDGSTTAYKLITNLGILPANQSWGQQTGYGVVLIGNIYTQSIYIKAAELNAIRIRNNATGEEYDFTIGTVPVATSGVLTPLLSPVGNGWYRASWSFTARQIGTAQVDNTTRTDNWSWRTTVTGDGKSGIYVWGPQFELGPTPTIYEPAGSAVFVNTFNRGGIPTPTAGISTITTPSGFYTVGSLDEVGINRSSTSPTNLISYSQQFDQSYWSAQNITVTPNATQAPDGTTTGALLTETAGLATHVLAQNISLPVPNATYTFSCYIKPYSRNRQFWFQFHETPAFNYVSEFANNSLATFDSVPALGGGANAQGQLYKTPTGSITPAANGWYRIALTVTIANQTASTTFNIGLYNAFAQSYVGDGTSGIYIWGSQVEIGSAATDYVPTGAAAVSTASFVERKSSTGLHRIAGEYDEVTYNPASGARRNLFANSENVVVNIGQSWGTTGVASILTPVYGVQGPDSTNNGIKLVESPGNRDHSIQTLAYSAVGLAVPAGQPVTLSVYLKAAERSFVVLQADNIGVVPGVLLNLQTGVVAAAYGGAVARIQAVGNGWYRCGFTTTPVRAANINMKIILSKNATFTDYSYIGELNNGIYIYGPQCELGLNLTTYVGTGTNAVPLT